MKMLAGAKWLGGINVEKIETVFNNLIENLGEEPITYSDLVTIIDNSMRNSFTRQDLRVKWGRQFRNMFERLNDIQETEEMSWGNAIQQGIAEKFAKDTEKFNTLYQTSNSMLQNLDLLDQLFSDPNVASGAAADTISSLKSLADSFGIKTEGLSAENVIASITGKMALQAKSEGGQNLMPGAMAASELTFLRNLVPQLTQSKEGRLLLSQVNRAMATRDMQLSEMAGRYADQYGGSLNAGFYKQARDFYKQNPLFTPEKLELMNEFAKRLARGGR
jgi:hypothetical protein